MNININIKKFSALFLTLALCITVFTVTAFAQQDPLADENTKTVEAPTDTIPAENEDNQANLNIDDPDEKITPEGPNPEESQPEISENENAPKPSDENTPKEETPEENEEINDKPSSEENSSKPSSIFSSSKPAPKPKVNVDTQKSRVEAAASQAAQAISDPDLLSSQSWNELLTSGEESEAESNVEAAAGTVSEPQNPGIAGVSWILILGVVLIVLALCGIVLFIYLQFFNKKGYANNRRKEPMVFEDISSDSRRELPQKTNSPVSHDTKVFTNVKSSTLPPKVNQNYRRRPASEKEETAPIPKFSNHDLLSKSKARPVNKNYSDWKKYFDDDDMR